MPESTRRFWVMLTVIAIVFSTARWLERRNNDPIRKHFHTESFAPKSHHGHPGSHAHKRKCRKSEGRVPKIDDFIFVHKEPVAVNYLEVREKIGYPKIAREANLEGTVTARVLVDGHGNYVRHEIISQPHPLLGQACEAGISSLRFAPAVRDGRPVMFWVNIPFNFHK
ncbi:MAG: energy transducer TonB [Bacteroidia bacterium]